MQETRDNLIDRAAVQPLSEVQELSDLELAFIAGGVGEVLFG